MKTLTYLFISIAATALIYVLFAASLDTYDLWAWDKPSQGFFLALVAIADLFLLRSYDKTSKQ